MTSEQQTRPVLLLDGPLEGQWREVAPGRAHATFFENIPLGDPRGLTPFSGDYKIMTVTVKVVGAEYTVTVGANRPRPDLNELVIRQLFTREAANVLLGLDVTT